MIDHETQPTIRSTADSAEKCVAWVKSATLVSVQLELARPIAIVYFETQPTIRSTADSAASLVLRVYLVEVEVASQCVAT